MVKPDKKRLPKEAPKPREIKAWKKVAAAIVALALLAALSCSIAALCSGCKPIEVLDQTVGTNFDTQPITQGEATNLITSAAPGVVAGVATGNYALVLLTIASSVVAMVKQRQATRNKQLATNKGAALNMVVRAVDTSSAVIVAAKAKELSNAAGPEVAATLKAAVTELDANILKKKAKEQ